MSSLRFDLQAPQFWLADFVEKKLSGHLDHNVANEVCGFIAPVGGIGEMAVDSARLNDPLYNIKKAVCC